MTTDPQGGTDIPTGLIEAVRSLAARNLITTAPGSDQVQVRGDLGIALAFQQRSRIVLDARVTGTAPDRPGASW